MVLFLLDGEATCFHKTHETFVARQHGDNLVRTDTTSRFHGTDVQVDVLEGGMSIGKEIDKRGPVNLGDIPVSKLEADNKSEIFERGKIS